MANQQAQASFIELFRKEYKALYLIALNEVKDEDIAKDIVQEFFIDFWEKRQGKVTGSFGAYAARAVKNASLLYFRNQKTADKRINRFGADTYRESDEEGSSLDREVLSQKVFAAIELLPPERKKVLLLSGREGLSNQEIADQLGISIHTVKSQLVKAYAAIRKHVTAEKNNSDEYDLLLNILILSCFLSVS